MVDSKDDDWYLYADDFDLNVPQRDRLDSTDSTKQEHGDLFDDILTAPTVIKKELKEDEQDDEFMSLGKEEQPDLEDSGSARFKADLTARTVQARLAAGSTSQSVVGLGGPYIYNEPNKKNSVFIGNLTWWTTDQDLLNAFSKCGFKTVKAVKFYENRSNGQSKGIALVELANETTAEQACTKMTEIEIHEKHPVLSYAMKTNLHQFELRCKQDDPTKPNVTQPKPTNRPSTTDHQNKIMQQHSMMSQPMPAMPMGGMPMMPPPMPPMMGPRPGMPMPPPPVPPMMRPDFPMPGMGFPMVAPPRPVAPHVNPAFFPDMQSGTTSVVELFAQAAARLKNSSVGAGISNHTEEEIQEANQRNRAVSSSAIQRAMTDANSGDYESAIDILKMAVSLIKQSITASSDASQILIQSLQDCLQSIEKQSSQSSKRSGRSSSRHHDDRERSRYRERERERERGSRHRDRSRERRR
ncbi:cleavage and polyadenylation specificity factor subunit 6-like [Dysidea avara]|uniref:cleavage and polyadenylation specificity factor subunit 6-like n=1 Tax=Dysidea avara TaxID=196820 RepID=UPI0033233C76